MDLENFVMKFLKDLPAATILGITSCLMVSRFNSKREPLVVLLPVNPILVGISEDECPDIFKSSKQTGDPPWGKSNVVERVAPGFKKIVKSHNSCSSQNFDQTRHNMLSFLTWMTELDKRVCSLMG
nr:hypothetical protein [Tanacetum cinerariifolium]